MNENNIIILIYNDLILIDDVDLIVLVGWFECGN